MRRVPFIDATGLHNLRIMVENSQAEGMDLILSGVNSDVRAMLEQYGIADKLEEANICSHIEAAMDRAEELLPKTDKKRHQRKE